MNTLRRLAAMSVALGASYGAADGLLLPTKRFKSKEQRDPTERDLAHLEAARQKRERKANKHGQRTEG